MILRAFTLSLRQLNDARTFRLMAAVALLSLLALCCSVPRCGSFWTMSAAALVSRRRWFRGADRARPDHPARLVPVPRRRNGGDGAVHRRHRRERRGGSLSRRRHARDAGQLCARRGDGPAFGAARDRWNLLAAPFYLLLLVTGVGTLVLVLLVNMLVLGRDLEAMVLARHPGMAPLSARDRNLLGLVASALFVIPVVNLLAPVLGAAMAVHLLHGRVSKPALS